MMEPVYMKSQKVSNLYLVWGVGGIVNLGVDICVDAGVGSSDRIILGLDD